MYRRAFLAVQYSADGLRFQMWGTSNVPWPPDQQDLQAAADRIAAANSEGRKPELVVITSLTWISDVREE